MTCNSRTASPTRRITDTSRWGRWSSLVLAGLLALAILNTGCSERRLAPPATHDSANVDSLRESFDEFYQPDD